MPKKASAEVRAGGAYVDTSRVANPIEIIALAGAFKDKAIKAGKAGLEENSHHMVNFTAQIVGSIAKSGAIVDGEMVPPKVDLTRLPTTCELLRRLGVSPKRLRDALLAVGEVDADEDELKADEHATVFFETAQEMASQMPMVPAKGVSARVTSVLSVRVIESA